MKELFSLAAGVITVYTLVCFLRVLFTAIPSWSYSRAGRILGNLCDPWLNLFRFSFLRLGNLDFSPVAALIVLSAASSLCSSIAVAKRVTLGIILAQAVNVAGQITSSLIGILCLLLVIRLAAILIAPHSDYGLWRVLDNSFAPLVSRVRQSVSAILGRNARPLSWTVSLLGVFIALVVINIVLGAALQFLRWILIGLPF